MALYSATVRVLRPGQPGAQDPHTGRPGAEAPAAEVYAGPAAVIDDASQEVIDRYGNRDAGGNGLIYFKVPMRRVGARVGDVVEADNLGYRFKGSVTAVDVLVRSVQVEWEAPPGLIEN